MKKLSALILSLVICFFVFLPVPAYADSVSGELENAEELFTRFVNENPSRVAGSKGEKSEESAAQWIKDYFDDLGYFVDSQSRDILDEFDFPADNAVKHSQNVVAYMNNGKDYDIIIGAHYDCMSVGEGADDNASGVTAMLLVAKALKTVPNLAYNIVFVAFGAEEAGLYGSTHYVSQMDENEIARTVMMINFDSIGMGDYLYVYGEDVKTEYLDTFVSAANIYSAQKEYGQTVYAKPISKDIIMNSLPVFKKAYPYYQTAQRSDHSPFRADGIPTTFFFSGNYESSFGYVQSENDDYIIMHTIDDTAQYVIEKRGGEFVKKIEIVSSTVFNVLTNNDFKDIIINARDELVSDFVLSVWPAAVVVLLLVAVAAIFSVLHLKKLNKRALLEDVEVKTEKVFKQQTGEDIYDFLK